MGRYFGTDGIRGEVGKVLHAELAFKLGYHLKESLKKSRVVIGYDTRESSETFAYSVASGVMASGADVLFAGVVSTPMIAYYAKHHKITGVMVTASHNPFTDNGLKVFDEGLKLSVDKEMLLEDLIDQDIVFQNNKFGNLLQSSAVKEHYKSLYVDLDLEKINLSVGFDSANGANYKIAHEILSSICDECSQIHAAPNGKNINLNCGSMHLEAIKELVREKQFDIGLSFDGDGDRVLVVDHNATLYDGDLIVYAIAKYLKSSNQLKKNTVVLTQMSNPGILKAFKDLGIKTVLTQVGDKYVTEEILKHGYSLGGENSGHIILNDHIHTGDGLFVGVYLLAILQKLKVTLKNYLSEIKMYPQKMVNIKNVDKNVLETKTYKDLAKQAQKRLGSDALFLVRASGTEPVIRVTISHQDESVMTEVIDLLVNGIETIAKEELS